MAYSNYSSSPPSYRSISSASVNQPPRPMRHNIKRSYPIVDEITPILACPQECQHHREANKNTCLLQALVVLVGLLVLLTLYSAVANTESQSMYWGEPIAGSHCAAYGTREYKARLWNIPFLKDNIHACKSLPIEIHNRTLIAPSRCEDLGFDGVYGYWLVDFDEPKCLPYWGSFRNLGCTAPGSHFCRFQSRLWGIAGGEDWMTLCATAPADIRDTNIPRPTHCENKGRFFGMYGIWDIYDPTC